MYVNSCELVKLLATVVSCQVVIVLLFISLFSALENSHEQVLFDFSV
jgi:hypothetical protein